MVCEQATTGREEGGGGLCPHPRFHSYDNPAFRASVILITNTVFLPNTASRDFSESRIPSRHFAFTRFPHKISVKTQIPRIPLQTLYEAEEGPVRRPKGTWFLSVRFRSLTVSCIVQIMFLRALISNYIKKLLSTFEKMYSVLNFVEKSLLSPKFILVFWQYGSLVIIKQRSATLAIPQILLIMMIIIITITIIIILLLLLLLLSFNDQNKSFPHFRLSQNRPPTPSAPPPRFISSKPYINWPQNSKWSPKTTYAPHR